MSGTLKIDCEVLETAVTQMKSAYDDFSVLTENGFKSEVELLDEMNSDFVDKFARVLEIAEDWKLKKLNKNRAHYISEAQVIYEEISKADEALAGNES